MTVSPTANHAVRSRDGQPVDGGQGGRGTGATQHRSHRDRQTVFVRCELVDVHHPLADRRCHAAVAPRPCSARCEGHAVEGTALELGARRTDTEGMRERTHLEPMSRHPRNSAIEPTTKAARSESAPAPTEVPTELAISLAPFDLRMASRQPGQSPPDSRTTRSWTDSFGSVITMPAGLRS